VRVGSLGSDVLAFEVEEAEVEAGAEDVFMCAFEVVLARRVDANEVERLSMSSDECECDGRDDCCCECECGCDCCG